MTHLPPADPVRTPITTKVGTYADYRRLMRPQSDSALVHYAALYAGNAQRMEEGARAVPARAAVARACREACRAIEDEQLARAYERRDDLHEDPADGDPFTQQEWDEIQEALRKAG